MNHKKQEDRLLNSEKSGDIVYINNTQEKSYGFELIMDLHGCDVSKFTREDIRTFFVELCDLINMQRRDLHFWDDVDTPIAEQQTLPHTKGTSAIQFILTSSIVIHTLDLKGDVYINIFSCKDFDEKAALEFCKEWFSSSNCISHHMVRA
jgi:S-adenosylmethionine/arginine decarboxylase-like enzyme